MRIGRELLIATTVVAVLALSAPPAHAVPTTRRVSVGAGNPGTQANHISFEPVLSNGARYVAFTSFASNLVPGDTNNADDIFLRDTLNNTTKRVSVASGSPGGQGTCPTSPCRGAHFPAMSADGRYVVFEADFNNLVAGDTNNLPDMFLRDTVANTTARVNVTSSGAQTFGSPSGSPSFPSISNDGKRVSFVSEAKEFMGEASFTNDAFVRDLAAKTTILVSRTTSGTPNPDQNQDLTRAQISGDGRIVGFHTLSAKYVSGDTNGKLDIFLRDLAAAKTTRVSLTSSGGQSNGASILGGLSTTGAIVSFTSLATNLVSGDTNGKEDAFVRRGTSTIRVNVSSSGAQANNQSICAWISGDGRYVAMCSSATNLVPGDTNGKVDTFWRDLQTGTTKRASVSSSGVQGNNISPWPRISPDGKFVAYESDATNLVSGDTNGKRDILLSGPLP